MWHIGHLRFTWYTLRQSDVCDVGYQSQSVSIEDVAPPPGCVCAVKAQPACHFLFVFLWHHSNIFCFVFKYIFNNRKKNIEMVIMKLIFLNYYLLDPCLYGGEQSHKTITRQRRLFSAVFVSPSYSPGDACVLCALQYQSCAPHTQQREPESPASGHSAHLHCPFPCQHRRGPTQLQLLPYFCHKQVCH